MPYFVTVKKTRGVPYLYAMYGEYVSTPEGKTKKVQRVVRSFGRLEPLLAKDPDFIEKVRMQYPNKTQIQRMELERVKASNAQNVQNGPNAVSATDANKTTLSVSPNASQAKVAVPLEKSNQANSKEPSAPTSSMFPDDLMAKK